MSHTTTTATAAAPRRSAAQWAIIAVLAILGVLAIIAAILFITGTANSIHFLSGSVHHGHHQVRLTVSIVAAVLLLAAAGYFMRTTSKSLCGTAGPSGPLRRWRAPRQVSECCGLFIPSGATCTVRPPYICVSATG